MKKGDRTNDSGCLIAFIALCLLASVVIALLGDPFHTNWKQK